MAHPCASIPCFATGPVRAFADARSRFSPACDRRFGPLPETAPWIARPNPARFHRTVLKPAHNPHHMNQRVIGTALASGSLTPPLSTPRGWRRLECGEKLPKESLPTGRPIESTAGHASFNCLNAKMSSPVHRRASSAPFQLRERIPGLPCPDPSFNCQRTLSRLTVFFIGNFSQKL